jgi:hypothetical protein
MPACECAVGCLCLASAAMMFSYYSYKSIESMFNNYDFDNDEDFEIVEILESVNKIGIVENVLCKNVEKTCCENIKPRL